MVNIMLTAFLMFEVETKLPSQDRREKLTSLYFREYKRRLWKGNYLS
jgi:hypothetical protein